MLNKLSIIIPVYNESVYIIRCLENVSQAKIANWVKEIIVINDGSTDNTLDLLEEFNREHTKIKIITSQINQGKGAALKKGISEAVGEVVIIQDADLEYDPSDYTAILSEFENKETNVVYGSRILGAKIYHNYSASLFFLLGGIMLSKTINMMFGVKLTDQPTCYKSWRNTFSKNLLKYCQSHGFEFEVEMTAFFSRITKIKEVPIHYYPRTVSHGKKIRVIDFIKSVLMVFRCKFIKRNIFSYRF